LNSVQFRAPTKPAQSCLCCLDVGVQSLHLNLFLLGIGHISPWLAGLRVNSTDLVLSSKRPDASGSALAEPRSISNYLNDVLNDDVLVRP
jgi:hypothetical protein